MRRTLTALAAAAALTAPSFASDWLVDRDASSVEFETTVFGGATRGAFDDFSAEITLDPDSLSSARIDAVVGTASGSMANNDYQSALTGGQGLAPEDHPEARFISDDIRAVDGGYEAHGALTIKGVEVELVLPFTLTIDGDRATAEGSFTVDRGAFGVGGSGWGDVGAEVTVILHIEADLAE
jgi:polyisoprenoid-binding protein YceI